MTLLELTIIILVLLSLMTILFIGARSWKRGSDRSMCIMNIQAVQKALRSYSNMYGYAPGATVSALQDKLIGPGCFVGKTPVCPGGGVCSCGDTLGPDVIPPMGELYFKCSFGSSLEHTPNVTSDW